MFVEWFSVVIVLNIIPSNCLKLDISREYFYHGKNFFCAQLQCTKNIREYTQISALVNMSVYKISESEGKILLASIAESDSKLQDYKCAGTRVQGKISNTFSELNIFFSNHSDCNGGIFLCEIHYVNTTGSIDRIGKQTESLQKKSRESFIMMNLKAKTSDYVKSVDTMADFLKSFEDPDRLKGADMTLSLQMSHSGGDTFIKDKDTELHNNYKYINSSSFKDMLDAKINNVRMDVNKTIQMMENQLSLRIQNETNKSISPYLDSLKDVNKTINMIENQLGFRIQIETNKTILSHLDSLKDNKKTLALLNESIQTYDAKTQKQLDVINLRLNEVNEQLKKTHNNLTESAKDVASLNQTLQYFLHGNYETSLKQCIKTGNSNLTEHIIVKLSKNKEAMCDTRTDGGGWILIQRRVLGDVNFFRNWDDYKNGFGSLRGDFWLGNDWISNLTQSGYSDLRFDMKYNGASYYMVYSNVTVGTEADLYRIKFSFKAGNIADQFTHHRGMNFTTFDRDNDRYSSNCAQVFNGGWWYSNDCGYVNLNGIWASKVSGKAIHWSTITGFQDSLQQTEMKLRRP